MKVSVHHTLELLEADMRQIVRRAPRELNGVVREGLRVGNSVAKDFARASSGTHARKYPGHFTTSMNRPVHLAGVSFYSGEYGPLPFGQGLLARILEGGSRNNPPHLDLARSADLVGPSFAQEVRRTAAGWFW